MLTPYVMRVRSLPGSDVKNYWCTFQSTPAPAESDALRSTDNVQLQVDHTNPEIKIIDAPAFAWFEVDSMRKCAVIQCPMTVSSHLFVCDTALCPLIAIIRDDPVSIDQLPESEFESETYSASIPTTMRVPIS